MIGSYIDFGIKTDRDELDILEREAVLSFARAHKPDVIIHLAGATDTARCERDPSYAYTLNVVGTYNVALAAQEVGATMVYLSTSRVFDGMKQSPYDEDDVPSPLGNYGLSKHLGELIVRSLVPNSTIVRTCWVFGGGPVRDNKFFGAVLRQLGGKEVQALDDVRGSPTYARDLIEAIKDLIAKDTRGVVHVANGGSATRYDIAKAMIEKLKLSLPVRAVKRDSAALKVLPANEAIVSTHVKLRAWQAALFEYIENEWRPYLEEEGII